MATIMIRPAAKRGADSSPVRPQAPSWIDAANRLITGQGPFGRLPERDLFDLVQRSTIRTLRRRECIFRTGDPGRSVFAVLEGYVKLFSTTAGGREVVLEIVGPGGCFGELAILNGAPRSADATAIGRCRLLAVDGRQFTQVMGRSPQGLQAMVQLTSRRLRTATQRVLDSVALPATARLAKTLLLLAELQSPCVRDGVRIALQLSQSELGGLAGITRESVNKHLGALRDAGCISQSGGSVTLLDIAALDSLLCDEGEPGSALAFCQRRAGDRRTSAFAGACFQA